ncbi:MAG: hypothetical protein IFK94_07510 [Acidobacteria bacterium]|uniref:Uncharacterized protein n=1 Tax=Candidatus Polarisedimenticola svalbardensis TaxID=2886004 RepID=A0A8J6Y2E2_9BACT|nr:hypothetical protein [Candidatus Polarisedimenticola svalbardensis]
MRKEEDIIKDGTEQDDPDAPMTAIVAILLAVVTVASVLALQGYFGKVQDAELRNKVVDVQPADLRKAREEGKALLEGYRWVDKEQGVVAIPIERAMELSMDRMVK